MSPFFADFRLFQNYDGIISINIINRNSLSRHALRECCGDEII
jgi:hypothetical protein